MTKGLTPKRIEREIGELRREVKRLQKGLYNEIGVESANMVKNLDCDCPVCKNIRRILVYEAL